MYATWDFKFKTNAARRGPRGGKSGKAAKDRAERFEKGKLEPENLWSEEKRARYQEWQERKSSRVSTGSLEECQAESCTTPVPSSSASVPGSGQGRRSQDSPKAVGTVSQATVLLQTRTLVIVDYHCVSDVSAAGCKPGTGFSDQAVEAFETFLREDSRHQLAVCSYIGSRSAERRRDLQSQVRSLNQYLGRKGVFQKVGLKIVATKEDKGPVVAGVRGSLFCDDQLSILDSYWNHCQDTNQEPTCQLVLFSPYNLPRGYRSCSLYSVASTLRDVLSVASRTQPIADVPSWHEHFDFHL